MTHRDHWQEQKILHNLLNTSTQSSRTTAPSRYTALTLGESESDPLELLKLSPDLCMELQYLMLSYVWEGGAQTPSSAQEHHELPINSWLCSSLCLHCINPAPS